MGYFEDIFELVKKHIFAVISIIFGIISIVGSVLYVNFSKESCELCEVSDPPFEKEETPVEVETPAKLVVDVKGAVKKPGVYELSNGSKIQDAITAAGGVAIGGSTANINLSKKLADEMVVYVFTKDELKKKEVTNEVVCEIPKCECETVTVTQCPEVNGNDKPNAGEPSGKDDKVDANFKVAINTASIEDFLKLDGIGESKAKAIVEYREKNGPFEKIEDIQKVSGIGTALYEKIADKLTL